MFSLETTVTDVDILPYRWRRLLLASVPEPPEVGVLFVHDSRPPRDLTLHRPSFVRSVSGVGYLEQ